MFEDIEKDTIIRISSSDTLPLIKSTLRWIDITEEIKNVIESLSKNTTTGDITDNDDVFYKCEER